MAFHDPSASDCAIRADSEKRSGVAAVGRIEFAVKPDLARLDCAQRNLIGRGPFVRVRQSGGGKAVGRSALAIAQLAAQLAHVVRRRPRTVISVHLPGIEQRAVAQFRRSHRENSFVIEAAGRCLNDVFVDAVTQIDEERTGGGEVADVGEVRTFADVESVDGLRHQPIEIGITLAMRMRRQIDWHVIDENREVSAVIKIVAA